MRYLSWLLWLVVAAAGQAPERDELASSYTHPWIGDGELLARLSDSTARVRVTVSPLTIAARHVDTVTCDGQPVALTRRGNVWQAAVPLGEHLVTVDSRAAEGRDPSLPWTAPPPGDSAAVARRLEAAAGEVVIPDGVYTDVRWTIAAPGTAAAPLLVRAQTPGQVVLRGRCAVQLSGSFGRLQGLRFEHCANNNTVLLSGDDNRVTQCLFFDCGDPRSTFGHVVAVAMGGDRNRVDHCYWTRSKSMSLAQRVSATGEVGRDNQFDHNVFRDVYRYWVNGQENIQIGQNQRGASGALEPRCRVEHNLFDHANGDSETISNKSSANLIRRNVAAWCDRATLHLRGGNNVLVDGNTAIGGLGGWIIFGRGHRLINNLVVGCSASGFSLGAGATDPEAQYAAATDIYLAHNTVVDGVGPAIATVLASPTYPVVPSGLTITRNVLLGAAGLALNGVAGDAGDNVVRSAAAAVLAVDSPAALTLLPGTVARQPRLATVTTDRLGRERPAQTVPGCDEAGSVGSQPAIPPRSVLDLALHRGPALADSGLAAERRLTDEARELVVELPAAAVLSWQHRPVAFSDRASVELPGGWRLVWQGLAKDGKPDGVIGLYDGDRLLAEAADLVLPYNDFRHQGWLGRTLNTATTPNPGVWTEFHWLQAPDFCLLVAGPTNRAVPVLGWPTGRPGGRVTLRQQGGGVWRGVAVQAWQEVDPTPPNAPAPTVASRGNMQVGLTWPTQPGVRYTVQRATAAGPWQTVAAGLSSGACDDFEVAAGETWRYRLQARTPAATVVGPEATLTFQPTGPTFRRLAADTAVVEPPLGLRAGGPAAPPAVWAPVAAPTDLEICPTNGHADFALNIPQAGQWSVYGWVQAPTEGNNSFWAQVGDAAPAVWHLAADPQWRWQPLFTNRALPAGPLRLRVRCREAGTLLGALLLTDDPTWKPTGP
ncbi:MAG: right-handed parallel beta-helix repeat-containing protein [Fimbriimonadaceae bacterium]|nr:right-handed parallel beta-helix repeat-containing protein [Fimbriimonadaceae bacterium]